jgi:CRP-like cAMP-binding protein
MPRKSPFEIVLTEKEKQSLEKMARKYTLPYYQIVRAKAILLAAQEWSNKEISEYLHLRREIVVKWRKRFYEEGLTGLQDRPRTGRPPVFSPSGRRRSKGSGL